jgi:hypothetical protein
LTAVIESAVVYIIALGVSLVLVVVRHPALFIVEYMVSRKSLSTRHQYHLCRLKQYPSLVAIIFSAIIIHVSLGLGNYDAASTTSTGIAPQTSTLRPAVNHGTDHCQSFSQFDVELRPVSTNRQTDVFSQQSTEMLKVY